MNYRILLSVIASLLTITTPQVQADPSSDLLLQKIEAMEAELKSLKNELKKKGVASSTANSSTSSPSEFSARNKENVAIDEQDFLPVTQSSPSKQSDLDTKEKNPYQSLGQYGITYRSSGISVDSMRLGAYGEAEFGRKDSGNGWNNGFDAHRIVLLGTYPISDDIIFNTEIEFEHGGIATDADDKLGGAVEIEQMFIDVRSSDYFTWRSIGVDVVPMGYVGLFHEPTQFYSVARPELYQGLIPSTWFTGSTSAYGKIVDGLTYQFQINSGLEDAGATAEEEDGSVPDGGYDAGISADEALKLARSPIGDRTQLGNNLGYALRLAYNPPSVPGLAGSTSVYYTNDVSPRGAYGTNANGSTRPLGKSDVGLFDTELRYRYPGSGFELRAEYATVGFGDPDNLRANNDNNPYNNVGNSMYGYSFEAAYHTALKKSSVESWELVPFYRYSDIKFQTSGVRGSDDNVRTGAGDKDYHTFGAALFPTPKVVFKLDYQLITDKDEQTPLERALLAGVGFFF